MSVLQDILEWATDRPVWQRDALRRLVTQEEVTNDDRQVLLRLCLEQSGVVDEESRAPEAQPLSEEHLPETDEAVERVQLVGVRDVVGVNTLAPAQRMGFELDGMTIIFGYNGSGKSGYARILRSLCHSRHRGDRILPNAFAEGEKPTPSATIDYRVGGADRSVDWQQGHPPPVELRQVSLFDAECAAVHVDDANELAFMPFGLDVMPKMVTICQRLSDSIQRMIEQCESAKPASLVEPRAAIGTQVRRLVDTLNETSNIETLRRLSDLTEDDIGRLIELQQSLGTDPTQRAREFRNAAERLRRLQQSTENAAYVLSEDAVEFIRSKHEDLWTKKRAARTAAEEVFGGQPLSGVGERVWHELWKAARAYSARQAYPDHEFPYVGDDSLCILCQQPLSRSAKERLATFEQFIKDETQTKADEAEATIAATVSTLEELSIGRAVIIEHLLDIPSGHLEIRRNIRRFHGVAWKLRHRILGSCGGEQWVAPCEMPLSPGPDLNVLIQNLLRNADECDRAADEDQRRTLLQEQREIEARQWLHGVLNDVESEIARRQLLASLHAAKRSTVTTGITRKSTELTGMYVTDVLRRTMTDEVTAVGMDYLRVALEPLGGQQGMQRFKVVLQGTIEDIKTRFILSEGEYRCIAMAGFLAELSTEHSGSTLVFDDPVSSLDHRWRRKVAKRLVAEVERRQVIVFTHEIGFLADLREFCEKAGVQLRHCYLQRGAVHSGECLDGLPWPAMKVAQRIGVLKNRHQGANALLRNNGTAAYEPEGRRIYGLLRETWERCVEELLINRAVVRFERAIQTQRLHPLTDISDADIAAIDEGMSKCSRFLEGHDEPGAVMDPVPEPAELLTDITALEDWVTQMKRRRN